MADAARIQTIVEAISRLSPAERRNLVRRLRVSGLLAADELTTDRQRLSVAPALGVTPLPVAPVAAQVAPPSVAPPSVAPPPVASPGPQSPSASAVRLRMATPPTGSDMPAVSGRVVLGSPQHEEAPDLDPHDMAPLPGRAPERPIVIALRSADTEARDGASGVYMLHWPGHRPQSVQVRFSGRPSLEQAHYEMLETALQAVMRRLRDSQADASTARLEIYLTSDQLIDELIGEEPVADARLMTQHDRVVDLLDRFDDWRLLRTGDPQAGAG
ncbi:MAG: hypothetical protein M9936_18000 [Caldilinea sp.]|nr:hypothetical protein [Caldilinea sp.]